jgi:4-hydroxyproline epimerase
MNQLEPPLVPLDVVDSHTAGEPTRTVVGGLPESLLRLSTTGETSLNEIAACMRTGHDWIRTSLIDEPRGSDVMVGAVLLPPPDDQCVASVIFFNNVGYLGMCGHGMIGVVTTLAWLGRIQPGRHRIATPVGNVGATFHDDGRVTITNVVSYRYRTAVPVRLASGQVVYGDIAWGGNWFFLCQDHGLEISPANIAELTRLSLAIRACLDRDTIRGQHDQVIDHIELVSAVDDDSNFTYKNYVLCPGLAYDRSPCGTGTSAKVACLAADGKLAVGESVRVIGISGESFEATYETVTGGPAGHVLPAVTGRAYVNGRWQVIFDSNDPFQFGIKA